MMNIITDPTPITISKLLPVEKKLKSTYAEREDMHPVEQSDVRARFVGVKAYEEAGGKFYTEDEYPEVPDDHFKDDEGADDYSGWSAE